MCHACILTLLLYALFGNTLVTILATIKNSSLSISAGARAWNYGGLSGLYPVSPLVYGYLYWRLTVSATAARCGIDRSSGERGIAHISLFHRLNALVHFLRVLAIAVHVQEPYNKAYRYSSAYVYEFLSY